MAKDRYPYPPDEFDLADRSNKPVGAHELPRSTWSKVWPFLLVLIIVPAIAFGAIKFISERNSVNPGQVAVDDDEDASTPASPPASPSVTPSDLPTSTSSPSESASEVDKSIKVSVLNASKVSRQAAKAKTKLTDDGWESVSAGDYTGTETSGENTVYYAKNSQKASAEEAAKVLGFDAVEKDTTQSPKGITVVIWQAMTD